MPEEDVLVSPYTSLSLKKLWPIQAFGEVYVESYLNCKYLLACVVLFQHMLAIDHIHEISQQEDIGFNIL